MKLGWRRALALVAGVVVALGTFSGTSGAAEPTPEERAAAMVRPGVVYIETHWRAYVQDHDGDWLGPFEWASSCSGFVVNPNGYVATAGHCVDDGLEAGARATAIEFGVQEWIDQGWADESQRAQLEGIAYANWNVEGEGGDSPPERTVYVQHGVATSGLESGQAWPARVVEIKGVMEGDVALLKVEQTNLPVVTIAQDADVAIGTEVMSIGYPASSDFVTDATLEPTYKDGKISSKKTREGGLLPVYETSAALSGGMSGGPTVNLDGEVVGLNSFNIVGETQAFNFLSPASLISEQLARNGVANELGPVDELYRQALDAYFSGDYEEAVAGFDQVLDRVPSHQQAQELRTQAASQEGSSSGDAGGVSPLILVAAILLLGGVLAGGVFAVVRTRGGKPQPAVAAPGPTVPMTATPQGPMPGAGMPPAGMPAAGMPAPEPVPAGTAPGAVDANGQAAVAAPPAPSLATRTAGRFCSACGTAVAAQAKFCPGCGHQVDASQGS